MVLKYQIKIYFKRRFKNREITISTTQEGKSESLLEGTGQAIMTFVMIK